MACYWMSENRGEGDARLSTGKLLSQLKKFSQVHATHILIMSYTLSTITCILILVADLEDAAKPFREAAALASIFNASDTAASGSSGSSGDPVLRRVLKSGGSVAASSSPGPSIDGSEVVASESLGGMFFVADVEESSGLLWISMGFALWLMFQ